MIPLTPHKMLPDRNHDETSRQDFVNDFRLHLASKVFPGNFPAYYNRVLPTFVKEKGREPKDRHEVRRTMTHDPYYSLWSAMQRSSQEMIWDSVIDSVERELPELIERAKQPGNKGSLVLDPSLEIPKYHTAADIHLQPGAYHSDHAEDDVAAGAIFDMGSYIYSMGSSGRDNDALGQISYGFFKKEFPDHKLERVLDMGCTVGGSVTFWALQEPEAEFHAIDVGAPVLRYGHARSEALGAAVHYSQQNAEKTNFEDGSFDLIMSHILLHETSRTALQNIFAECHRLLKPGGIMMHLDLPQAHGAPPLEGFLFEWEIYNNNEHFYAHLRDLDLDEMCKKAGFKAENVRLTETGSYWMDDSTPYSDDGFVFPVTLAIK